MYATKNKTISYFYDHDHMIDIVTKQVSYEAWIYNIDCGDKHFMFGCPKSQQSYFDFMTLVKENAENYMDLCENERSWEYE